VPEHGELVLGADRGRACEHHHNVRVTGYLKEKIVIFINLNVLPTSLLWLILILSTSKVK
jgi:hypothetical protein